MLGLEKCSNFQVFRFKNDLYFLKNIHIKNVIIKKKRKIKQRNIKKIDWKENEQKSPQFSRPVRVRREESASWARPI